MLVFFKLKSYGMSGQIFGLLSSFLNNKRLQVVLDRKSLQEYTVDALHTMHSPPEPDT